MPAHGVGLDVRKAAIHRTARWAWWRIKIQARYLGSSKTMPHSRFSWNVRARSIELIGVLFCSPRKVVKLSVPSVYQ